MFKYTHNYFIDGKFQFCILLLNSHKLIYYDVHICPWLWSFFCFFYQQSHTCRLFAHIDLPAGLAVRQGRILTYL